MTTQEKVLYTGKTHTTGGREGFARSDDAQLDVRLSPPGGGKAGTSLPGIDADLARSLIAEAHQTCPYSKATRGNIEVDLTLA
ncbi:hypothetical protein [Sinorhizobium meliloti]|uniref:hypothetical protein n=1 Tax=Rhizobium meliloti TaxID=382 RepID=UPI000FD26598|nr:hypothetical protein [Sinorhizobium meliloti]RVR13255.1 hypothetical protein CN243_01445 [Sinorhizobium meliloti]